MLNNIGEKRALKKIKLLVKAIEVLSRDNIGVVDTDTYKILSEKLVKYIQLI